MITALPLAVLLPKWYAVIMTCTGSNGNSSVEVVVVGSLLRIPTTAGWRGPNAALWITIWPGFSQLKQGSVVERSIEALAVAVEESIGLLSLTPHELQSAFSPFALAQSECWARWLRFLRRNTFFLFQLTRCSFSEHWGRLETGVGSKRHTLDNRIYLRLRRSLME